MREGGRLGEGRAGPRAEGGLRAQMQAAWRGGGGRAEGGVGGDGGTRGRKTNRKGGVGEKGGKEKREQGMNRK